MAKCLYCYKELNEGEKDFHRACSKKMFGTPSVPVLPYTRENLTDLAKQVIRSQAIFGCAKVGYGKLLGAGCFLVDNGQCRYAPEKLFAI